MANSRTSKSTSKGAQASFKSTIGAQVSPEHEGTEPDALIFPEWSDQELNAEKWEPPRSPTKDKEHTERAKDAMSDSDNASASPRITLPPPPLPFRDPHSFTLPASLDVYKWLKPEVAFPGKTFVVYKETGTSGTGSPLVSHKNVMAENSHILTSTFMRTFVASITILEYLSHASPWPMEGVTASYTPTVVDEPWRPWHHVYSNCKAGKGQKHRPQVNKLGKYVLRVFWLGAWRRIVVDDFLPVDKNYKLLLPVLYTSKDSAQEGRKKDKKKGKEKEKEGVKEKEKGKDKDMSREKVSDEDVIELWPFLLCKGLLKLANLTWTKNRETYDISLIYNLTGWTSQKLNTYDLDSNEIWEVCSAYSPHYKWPDEDGVASEKKSKKTKKPLVKPLNSENTQLPYVVLAKTVDTKYNQIEDAHGAPIPPIWSHIFLINQIRDIPLDRPDKKPTLAPWKRFRWIDWAKTHGLYTEEETDLKYLELVDFFKDVHFESSLGSIRRGDPVYFTGGDKLQIESSMGFASSREVRIDMTRRSGRGEHEQIGPVSQPSLKGRIEEDGMNEYVPNAWVDFKQFGKFIDKLYIFFKPQMMHSCVTITDLEEKRKTAANSKDGKRAKSEDKPESIEHTTKRIIWPYKLQRHQNQPLYLFCDTLDPKVLIVSLRHSGNREILEQKCVVVHCDLTSLWQKKFVFAERCQMRTTANIILEKYDWESETFGGLVLGLNTTGDRSETMALPEGRQVLRLWISTDSPYTVTILSDCDLEVGPLEYILEVMQWESERCLQFCLNIGTAFGNLVQAFGTIEYLKYLREFCASFRPELGQESKEWKKVSMRVKEDFLEVFTGCIKDVYTDCGEALFCLRVLFLCPSLGRGQCPPRKETATKTKVKKEVIKVQAPPVWDDDECLSDTSSRTVSVDEVLLAKQREAAACKIQAFFKMIYVRKLMEYHGEHHSLFNKVFETLKKIYKDLFNVDKRIMVFPGVCRRLMLKVTLEEDFDMAKKWYAWAKDLGAVVNNQIISGAVPVPVSSPTGPPNSWVALGRWVFFVDTPYDERVKISVFSDIQQVVLRVVNNDTLEETFRGVNCPCVETYCSNAKGYTILGYGWTDQLTQIVNFKISLVTLRKSERLSLIILETPCSNLSVSDLYHHNKKGLIGRTMVGIMNDMALTLRLKCSYKEVLIRLRCLTKEGKLVKEVTGKEVVVMPVIDLVYKKAEEDDIRQGEVQSLGQSQDLLSSKSSAFRKSKKSLTSMSTTQLKKKSSSFSLGEKLSHTASLSSIDSRRAKMSKTSKISKISKKALQKEDARSYYVIEAQVLKQSWPLTKDEWKESDKVIKRNYLGVPPPQALTSSGSSKSILKRMSALSQSMSKDYESLPNPKWSLQIMYNSEEIPHLALDKSRSQEILTKKLKWLEDQPGRMEEAKRVRENYLQEMRDLDRLDSLNILDLQGEGEGSRGEGGIASSYDYEDSYFDGDESVTESRTLIHPDTSGSDAKSKTKSKSRSKRQSQKLKKSIDYSSYTALSISTKSQDTLFNSRLSTLRTESTRESFSTLWEAKGRKCYELLDDEFTTDGILKKQKDFEKDVIKRQIALDEFEEYHQQYVSNMDEFREKTLMKSNNLQDWFDGIRTESQELMSRAYGKRQKYIDMLKEEDAGGKMDKKDKKEKKGKKDKKSKESKSSKSSKRSKSSKSAKASKKSKK